MTQTELDRAVALATGESLQSVRNRGFSILPDRPECPDPEDLSLALDCPCCGRMIPYPGRAGKDAAALATCPACVVEFPFDPHEIYATDTVIDGTTIGASGHGLSDYR